MKSLLFAILISAVSFAAHAADPSNEITLENVVRLMNDYRGAAGLSPLRVDPRLAAAAADRMQHMEEEAFWAHDSPDGVSPFVWLKTRAYPFAAAGENLAAGFETVRLLVASWMESPGHRANILSRDYEDCGIAIIDGGTRGPASGRSVVVLFGRQRTTAPMSAAAGR